MTDTHTDYDSQQAAKQQAASEARRIEEANAARQARDATAAKTLDDARVQAEKKSEPKTAKEVLARVDEDHNWDFAPIDMSTTGGIQKAIERNWRAIQALAAFVDGRKV
jgi:hypothetical protein